MHLTPHYPNKNSVCIYIKLIITTLTQKHTQTPAILGRTLAIMASRFALMPATAFLVLKLGPCISLNIYIYHFF